LHPLGSVDPVRDARALEEEIGLDDLVVIEKRIERLEKEQRRDREHELLVRCKEIIETGNPLRSAAFSPPELRDLAGFGFLSMKPLMLIGNYGEESVGKPDPSGLQACAAEAGHPLVDLCGKMEMEVSELPEAERQAFREEFGLGEESRTQFLHSAYDMLGLISFLTAGDREVRAWTIPSGTHAVDAAGVVHTDMQRGFIRAEVCHYENFAEDGDLHKAKEHGHLRLEGKDYVVEDGDIILFRFNV